MMRAELLEEMERRAAAKGGRRGGIHAHSVAQADLTPENPWPVKFGSRDVASRVVDLMSRSLLDDQNVDPLAREWIVFQGVQSGADAYSARIQRRLPGETIRDLAMTGAQTGSPILELPPGMESEQPWSSASGFLAKNPEPRAILYAALDDADYTHVVRLESDDSPPQAVIRALERWKPVLETRADIVANPGKPWWAAHRARDRGLLQRPKVIALGTFGATTSRFA